MRPGCVYVGFDCLSGIINNGFVFDDSTTYIPGVYWDLCFLYLLTVNIYPLLVMDTPIYIL